MIRAGRLDSTIKLAASDDQLNHEALQQARASMQARPRVLVHPNSDHAAIITNAADKPLRVYGRDIHVPYEQDGVIAFQNGETNDVILVSERGDDSQMVLGQAYGAVQVITSHHHAQEYDLYDGVAEEYDDVAQVISQLNLGRSADAKVTLSSPQDVDGELFRITPNDPERNPEVAGVLYPVFPAITQDEEVIKAYRAGKIQSSMPAQEPPYKDVIMSLEEVRTTISQNEIVHPQTGKLYLPRGWTDE